MEAQYLLQAERPRGENELTGQFDLLSASESEHSESDVGSEDDSVDKESLADLTLVSGKRKYEDQHKGRVSKVGRASRLGYVELLNSEIRDATAAQDSLTAQDKEDSDYRRITWSSQEKSLFFHELTRSRQDLVRGLHDVLPSKSDIEVLDFQRELAQHALYHETKRLTDHVSRRDVPPALEIGQSCCQALEDAADEVSSLQWRYERQEEQGKFGEYSLLSKSIAEEIEIQVDTLAQQDDFAPTPRPHKPIKSSVVDAASLLCLGNWVELSERIFMNSPTFDRSQGQQITMTDDSNTPAIFATTFIDFFNLAVSVTRRLVSVALFQAASRLRATDNNSRTPHRKLFVQKCDVLTACGILGLKSDSHRFWRESARRLNLEVYPKRLPTWHDSKPRHYKSVEEKMTYREVEQNLRVVNDVELPEGDDLSTSSAGESESEISRETSSNVMKIGSDLEDKDEDYLEAQDRLEGSKEERRIWQHILGSSENDKEPIHDENLAEPEARRKDRSQLKDWTVQTDFCSDWERYGEALPQKDFGDI